MAYGTQDKGLAEVYKNGTQEYFKSKEARNLFIEQILTPRIEELKNSARFFLEETEKILKDNSKTTILNQLNIADMIKEVHRSLKDASDIKNEIWKKATAFQQKYNKLLDRTIIGNLVWKDGHINFYSEETLQKAITDPNSRYNPNESSSTKATISDVLKEYINKADLEDGTLLKQLQSKVDQITDYIGVIYQILLLRRDNLDMGYKVVKDKNNKEIKKYSFYWWNTPYYQSLNYSKNVQNRGVLGQAYTALVLTQRIANLKIKLKARQRYTQQQSRQIQDKIEETDQYIGSYDSIPGAIQGDVIASFNGSRIQIAVKAETSEGLTVSSQALGPIFAIAEFIGYYDRFKVGEEEKVLSKEQVAEILCDFFYTEFTAQGRKSATAESIYKYFVDKVNKEFKLKGKNKFKQSELDFIWIKQITSN